ncbi:cupin domain-containing protein [Chryseobacterium lactis]|uniref:Cupin domain-containing protein n=1 Tax=Chryseobacterium lactis TaxID=1241981 RepID=A0A3G6RI93_CHRLC|nr:cupin domain-containing protein [Chryseobacterium lactis]AZA82548.1 cupin domain-containing protein [Chryseobacterium lactis]AZB02929.1 cupin domain-containing protein [Chryseobacterium lactis]PNW13776.1 cupin domain-containing protein [Chryseobacterium lactis]
MKTIPRRILTGIKDGKSTIVEDRQVENAVEHFPGLIISDVWNTQKTPASLAIETRIPNTGFPQTPKNGTYFRYVVVPPDKDLGIDFKPGKPHPMMHQTSTLDYIIILSGELYLIMEEGETLLRPGDIVIQRGTNHAWSNRSDEPCIQLAVLIDAES